MFAGEGAGARDGATARTALIRNVRFITRSSGNGSVARCTTGAGLTRLSRDPDYSVTGCVVIVALVSPRCGWFKLVAWQRGWQHPSGPPPFPARSGNVPPDASQVHT